MKRTLIVLLAIALLHTKPNFAQMPAGFSWIGPQSDKVTMTIVHRALKIGPYTAIRKVGVQYGFALVLTTSRESESETDRWSIHNVALASGNARILVSGYRVRVLDWIGTTSPELALAYYDCWGCEAATLFTTLHCEKGLGWTARWPNKNGSTDSPQPGAVMSYGDAGEPYDDNEVDQVFAVVSQPDGSFAAGSWFHSRNTKTGKTENDVEKYSIDPATGEERIEKLSGARSLEWRRRICSPPNSQIKVMIGQNSKACQNVLKTKAP